MTKRNADDQRLYVKTVLAIAQEIADDRGVGMPGYYVDRVDVHHPWQDPNTWTRYERIRPTPEQIRMAKRLASSETSAWPKTYRRVALGEA